MMTEHRTRVHCNRRPLCLEPLEERATPATFSVADGDVAGLISAINTANVNDQDDTIRLAVVGTYTLTEVNNDDRGAYGLPYILSDDGHMLTVKGMGATVQRSENAPEFGIFLVYGDGKLVIDRLTIRNGNDGTNPDLIGLPPPIPGGGGINNQGTLSLLNSSIVDNIGAGVSNFGKTVSLVNTLVSENKYGGEIQNHGTLTIQGSTIFGNTNNFSGGGIDQRAVGSLTVQDSTISGNSAASGGGISSSYGTATVTNSTINGNRASYSPDSGRCPDGGGIYLEGGE